MSSSSENESSYDNDNAAKVDTVHKSLTNNLLDIVNASDEDSDCSGEDPFSQIERLLKELENKGAKSMSEFKSPPGKLKVRKVKEEKQPRTTKKEKNRSRQQPIFGLVRSGEHKKDVQRQAAFLRLTSDDRKRTAEGCSSASQSPSPTKRRRHSPRLK